MLILEIKKYGKINKGSNTRHKKKNRLNPDNKSKIEIRNINKKR